MAAVNSSWPLVRQRKHSSRHTTAPPQKTLPVFVEEKRDEALLKEFGRKRIQFLLVFDILKHRRPMTDYEWQQKTLSAHPSFAELMPSKHKSDDAGWEIADAIDHVLLLPMQRCLAEVEFIGISVDASCAVDNVDYLNLEARVWFNSELHLFFVCMKALGEDCAAVRQEKLVLEGLSEFGGVKFDRIEEETRSGGC